MPFSSPTFPAQAGPQFNIIVNPGFNNCAPVWVNNNLRPRIWPSAGVNRVPDPVFITQPVVTTTTFRWRR